MGIRYPEHNIDNYFTNDNDVSSNAIYELGNWQKYSTEILDYIHSTGGAIWLTTQGDLCYRLAPFGNIYIATASKISLVFSNFLQQNIQIIKKQAPIITNTKLEHDSRTGLEAGQIYTNQLLLVEGDKFNPCEPKEFYQDVNKLTYRNTFKPTHYLLLEPNNKRHNQFYTAKYKSISIILQYIFYLVNYDQSRFNYIMNWLASFFKNLSNKSNIALVLIGKQESGKDILFNEIIKPLFGNEYCIRINNDNIQTNDLSNIVKEKLFYNFDEISDTVAENQKIKNFLKDFIDNDTVSIKEKNKDSNEIQIFGQTLITISDPYLPYADKDNDSYTVFNISSNIKNIDIFDQNGIRINISKKELLNNIKDNLESFALLLKGFSVDRNQVNQAFLDDDKECMVSNTEDKLKAFSDAIVNHTTNYFEKIQDDNSSFYKELMKDFGNRKIKQSNIGKSFSMLYKDEKPLSGKTLMVKLRQINNNFFKKEAIFSSGGIKYYNIT